MEERYIYTSLNEVPVKWRTYKGARLSLQQINDIIEYAYENKLTTSTGLIPDYGEARNNFESTHKIESELWVTV